MWLTLGRINGYIISYNFKCVGEIRLSFVSPNESFPDRRVTLAFASWLCTWGVVALINSGIY